MLSLKRRQHMKILGTAKHYRTMVHYNELGMWFSSLYFSDHGCICISTFNGPRII